MLQVTADEFPTACNRNSYGDPTAASLRTWELTIVSPRTEKLRGRTSVFPPASLKATTTSEPGEACEGVLEISPVCALSCNPVPERGKDRWRGKLIR